MSELQKAIDDVDAGLRTSGELENVIFGLCYDRSAESFAILDGLESHANLYVREAACNARDSLEKIALLVTDIDEVRIAAPFQPGVRVRLSGGYSHTKDQWWLGNRGCRSGKFIDFYPNSEGSLPAAIIDLDQPIDLTERTGRRHVGKFALARIHTLGDPWHDRATVMIHIVDVVPKDAESYFASHHLGNELESHATLEIASDAEQDVADQRAARCR